MIITITEPVISVAISGAIARPIILSSATVIGPQGDQGEPGSQGPAGPQGNAGAKGDTGSQGPIGPTGATGAKGDKGDQGDPATNLVSSVAGKQGAVTLDKSDVGLSSVDNTADTAKPVSTAQQTALDTKVDKVTGKQLSTQDYTTTEKSKLAGIATGATANQTDAYLLSRTNHTGTQTASTINDFSTAADARITAQKGSANGLATLDGTSKIPTSQLPALAITSTFVVASQAAQLALAAQEGDVAVRTDLNKSYIQNGGTSGTMTDWQELLTPTDTVTSVNSQTGSVTLTTSNISEGSNLYYTAARALSAISMTNTGTSGAATYNNTTGILNIPAYLGSTTALTSGSVLFSNGTTVTQDNANLFWDNTNKRLGIGTNTPNYKLEVNGAVSAGNPLAPILLLPWSGQGGWIDLPAIPGLASGIGFGGLGTVLLAGYAGLSGQWFSDASVGDSCHRNLTGRILFGNSAGQSALAVAGDKVGVGKSNPQFPLDFTQNVGDKLCLYASSSTDHYGLGVTGGTLEIHTDFVASDIRFGYGCIATGITESARIKSTGRAIFKALATGIRIVTATTATYGDTDQTILADATAASITLDLPAASTCPGIIYNAKKIDATANTVTIDPNGAETIDGAATKVISVQYQSLSFQSNGTAWFII